MFKKSDKNQNPNAPDLEAIQNRLAQLRVKAASIPTEAIHADEERTADLWDTYLQAQREIADLEAVEAVALKVRAEHQRIQAIKDLIAKIGENNRIIAETKPLVTANKTRSAELEKEVRELDKERRKLGASISHAHYHNLDLQMILKRDFGYIVPNEELL